MHVLGGPRPSTSQRSSVRGFRRSSAASSSFVRNSERIGSKLDMAVTYTLFCVHQTTWTYRDLFELGGELIPRDGYSSNGEGANLLGFLRACLRAYLIISTT
jgi:hypothetical protein